MTNATKLADEIEALAAKATPGPWEVDSEYDNDALYSSGGGCGRGFKNFFIGADVGGKWMTLLDTQNSDHKLVEEEYDEDGSTVWDTIGSDNTALIVALRNNLPTILAALRERDALAAEAETAKQMRETARELGYADTLEALEALAAYKAMADEMARAVEVADSAIAEWFRYLYGGEMRGSYDGKPERDQLQKAGYTTRTTLSRYQAMKDQADG